VRGKENAVWIVGRILFAFRLVHEPGAQRSEKSCMDQAFVAILHEEENLTIPFDVSDIYGRAGLWFSTNDGPSAATQKAIADAFYDFLLDEPLNVVDYEDRFYHDAGGSMVEFGNERGEPYMDF